MRYHFNLINHTERILDDIGIEVSTLEQAQAQALKAVQEMRAEGEDSAEWDEWRLEVSDAAGAVAFSVSLSGRLH
ncbi:hypothetical protein MAE02_63250 [Microvirga aerophila]|uniref:DUF6894 domain-containing protein n=2 Tax=Microvirga aerophila TaxID=670291 RepID=A0A512C345_9HYPH|nr:hypothetical protein MAE02_63250 [Microvirga aerophila]